VNPYVMQEFHEYNQAIHMHSFLEVIQHPTCERITICSPLNLANE